MQGNRFISEKQLEEQRSNGSVPKRDEGEYDPRPLYEKLQANRKAEEAAFAEKLSKGRIPKPLDKDEIDYFQEKIRQEERKRAEIERDEIEQLVEFRRSLARAPSAKDGPSLAFAAPKQKLPSTITKPLAIKIKPSPKTNADGDTNNNNNNKRKDIERDDSPNKKPATGLNGLLDDYRSDSDGDGEA